MLRIDTGRSTLTAFGHIFPCAIGRGGAVPAAEKREGDGATPLGRWPILAALLRPDRVAVPTMSLPWRWMRPSDGWSDDPADPCYNRPVSHPHAFGAERLWREDAVYDIVVVLGHNTGPVVAGAGSAIFWHVAHPDFRPTEGCVAIARAGFETLLGQLAPGAVLEIA